MPTDFTAVVHCGMWVQSGRVLWSVKYWVVVGSEHEKYRYKEPAPVKSQALKTRQIWFQKSQEWTSCLSQVCSASCVAWKCAPAHVGPARYSRTKAAITHFWSGAYALLFKKKKKVTLVRLKLRGDPTGPKHRCPRLGFRVQFSEWPWTTVISEVFDALTDKNG